MQTLAIANIDFTFIHIENKSQKITLGLVYRPPAQSHAIDEQVYEQISGLCCANTCVIMGNFNLPVTRWGEPFSVHTCRQLYTSLLESSLHQHVMHPTRGNNILDIVLTNDENTVKDLKVGPEFRSSDHLSLSFTITLTKLR